MFLYRDFLMFLLYRDFLMFILHRDFIIFLLYSNFLIYISLEIPHIIFVLWKTLREKSGLRAPGSYIHTPTGSIRDPMDPPWQG